jgi:hypothetical protein
MRPISLPATTERVRLHTSADVNERIRLRTLRNVDHYRGRTAGEIAARIAELDREWDTERVLETSAAGFTMIGTALGFARRPAWFVLPGVVGFFLMQHALQGWCPPLSVIRRLGVRSAAEIEEERTALRALRGGFTGAR